MTGCEREIIQAFIQTPSSDGGKVIDAMLSMMFHGKLTDGTWKLKHEPADGSTQYVVSVELLAGELTNWNLDVIKAKEAKK